MRISTLDIFPSYLGPSLQIKSFVIQNSPHHLKHGLPNLIFVIIIFAILIVSIKTIVFTFRSGTFRFYLGIPIAELVDIDLDDVGVVVELDETLTHKIILLVFCYMFISLPLSLSLPSSPPSLSPPIYISIYLSTYIPLFSLDPCFNLDQ